MGQSRVVGLELCLVGSIALLVAAFIIPWGLLAALVGSAGVVWILVGLFFVVFRPLDTDSMSFTPRILGLDAVKLGQAFGNGSIIGAGILLIDQGRAIVVVQLSTGCILIGLGLLLLIIGAYLN